MSQTTPELPVFSSRGAFITASICAGCAAAVLMWWAWFLSHLPGLNLPKPAAIGLIFAAWLAGLTLLVRLCPRSQALSVGITSGLLAALLNLTVLGSYLTKPPAPPADTLIPIAAGTEVAARPSAMLIVAGFLIVGLVCGIASAGLSRLFARPARHDARAWLGRMAIVGCGATLPLLVLGGLVTSTESGMAVPDAPTTYGSNMFLYPIELMAHPRVFLEHTHRLFGTLVGLTTFALGALVFALERRQWARQAAALLFILVVIQGLLGMLRVDRNSLPLAITHGVVAQIFFALMVAQACWLSPLWLEASATSLLPRAKRLATGLIHAMLLQLVLGAAFRHLDGVSKGAMHILWTHVAFALAVTAMAILAGAAGAATPIDDPRRPVLRRAGLGLIAVVALQVILGFSALLAVLASPERGPSPTAEDLRAATAQAVPALEAALATAHQANGAIMLGLAAVIATFSRRRSAPSP